MDVWFFECRESRSDYYIMNLDPLLFFILMFGQNQICFYLLDPFKFAVVSFYSPNMRENMTQQKEMIQILLQHMLTNSETEKELQNGYQLREWNTVMSSFNWRKTGRIFKSLRKQVGIGLWIWTYWIALDSFYGVSEWINCTFKFQIFLLCVIFWSDKVVW